MVGSGSGSLMRLQSSCQLGLQSSEGPTGPEGSAFLLIQVVVGSIPHCCSLDLSAPCHKGLSIERTAHSKAAGLSERAPKIEASLYNQSLYDLGSDIKFEC